MISVMLHTELFDVAFLGMLQFLIKYGTTSNWNIVIINSNYIVSITVMYAALYS